MQASIDSSFVTFISRLRSWPIWHNSGFGRLQVVPCSSSSMPPPPPLKNPSPSANTFEKQLSSQKVLFLQAMYSEWFTWLMFHTGIIIDCESHIRWPDSRRWLPLSERHDSYCSAVSTLLLTRTSRFFSTWVTQLHTVRGAMNHLHPLYSVIRMKSGSKSGANLKLSQASMHLRRLCRCVTFHCQCWKCFSNPFVPYTRILLVLPVGAWYSSCYQRVRSFLHMIFCIRLKSASCGTIMSNALAISESSEPNSSQEFLTC